ncbi:MAG: hypothetical protein M5U23_02550 [Acidimicrobiia bacterium]|nr:hypothetical protein [Acidimicrobiia bacterium]
MDIHEFYETLRLCDTEIWQPRGARKQQIRALMDYNGDWTKRNIVIWRDNAELGWQLGANTMCKILELAQVAGPTARTLAAARDKRLRPQAGLVARAVGGALAPGFYALETAKARERVAAMADPFMFVITCAQMLNDGEHRTANGGPILDESQPMDPGDISWVALRRRLDKIGIGHLDISKSRSSYAPV